MSRSWGEALRVMRRLGLGLLALALAVMAAIALVEAFPAHALAKGEDTTRTVRHVKVGPGGIEIEGQDHDAGEAQPRGRGGASVQIGPAGVRIDAADRDSERRGVDVDIPGVHVHGGSGGSDAMVRAFSDIHVAKGEVVDGDVVAVIGSVTVEGRVRGDVVAVCGSVLLKPGAVVEGSAVAIGGVLEQPDGASVGDQTVSLGFLPVSFGLPTLPILLLTIVVGWLLTVFMSWLLAMLLPERVLRVASTVSRNPAGSFFLGIVSLPLVVILCLLLFVTVIGLPIAFLLPLFYVVAVWAGQIAATYLLGCRLMRRRAGEASIFGPAVAGSLFVALFFVTGALLGTPQGVMTRSLGLFFTLLGLLLVTGLSILGTGAFLLSRAGGRPREPRPAVASPSPIGGPLPSTPPPATG